MFTSCFKASSLIQKNIFKASFRHFSTSKIVLSKPVAHIKPIAPSKIGYSLLTLAAVGGYGAYSLQPVKNDVVESSKSAANSIYDSGKHIKRELTGEEKRVSPMSDDFANNKESRHKIYREIVVGCLFGLVGGTTVRYFAKGLGYFIAVGAVFIEILAARNIVRMPTLSTSVTSNTFLNKISSSCNKFINFICKEPVFRGAGLLTFFMAFTA